MAACTMFAIRIRGTAEVQMMRIDRNCGEPARILVTTVNSL